MNTTHPRRLLSATRTTLTAVLALLITGSAVAEAERGDERVFAPVVRNAGQAGVNLTLRDESERGILVELRLHHANGRSLHFGRHPVIITRAVPPGESLVVDLAEFTPSGFDGWLELTSTGSVGAHLESAELSYPLVSASAEGEVSVAARSGSDIEIAVVSIGEGTDVHFEELRDGASRSRLGPTLGEHESARLSFGMAATVQSVRWVCRAPVALIVWEPVESGAARPFSSR